MALELAGIEVSSYYASEIDRHAIKITQANYPKTKQLGNVLDVKGIKDIDLLMGGSPCQGFSVNGKKLNFEDERSKLLFEYIRIRDETNPKYWLLENVATMSQQVKHMIDEFVGVEGVVINSNLFSAQNRKRLYWTNIPLFIPSEISELTIKDIVENEVDKKHYLSNEKISKQCINQSCTDGVITLNPKMHSGQQTYQQDRIYDCIGKMVALTATLGNRFNIKDNNGIFRRLTIREQARLQTIPEKISFENVTELQASKCIGNGWTVDVISHMLKNIKKYNKN